MTTRKVVGALSRSLKLTRRQVQDAKRGMGNQASFNFKGERQKLSDDESKYCVIHQQHGHSTEACLWLKNRLKEKKTLIYKDDREKRGENKESGN